MKVMWSDESSEAVSLQMHALIKVKGEPVKYYSIGLFFGQAG